MTEGWVDRQLKRVQEVYDSLPPWQKTAKTTDGGQSQVSRPCASSDQAQEAGRTGQAKSSDK